MASKLGEAYVVLTARNSELKKAFEDAKGDSQKFMKAVQADLQRTEQLANRMALAVTLPILGLVTAASRAYLEIDSLNRGLEAIMGSADAASREMEKLREVAKLPGLGFKESVEASVGLQAAGLSADQAREALMGFGKALGQIGKGKYELQRVNDQLVQMMGVGKVMYNDVRIIRNWVPQLSEAMRKAFGTTSAEEISKMGVGAEEFIRRISAELNKLPAVTDSVKNSFENAMDNMQIALYKLGQSFGPAIQRMADIISGLANMIGGLNPIMLKWGMAVLLAAAAFGPLLKIIVAVTKAVIWYRNQASLAAAVTGRWKEALAAVTAVAIAIGIAAVGEKKLEQEIGSAAADAERQTAATNAQLAAMSDNINQASNALKSLSAVSYSLMPKPETYEQQAQDMLDLYKNTKRARQEEEARQRSAIGFTAIGEMFKGAAAAGGRHRFGPDLEGGPIGHWASYTGPSSNAYYGGNKTMFTDPDWNNTVRIWQKMQASNEEQERNLRNIADALQRGALVT